jgi:D-sedoheptulose 7-phosphate isomerase
MTATLPRDAYDHLDALGGSLDALRRQATTLQAWGTTLAQRLSVGHRLLAAGNGGSAAEAQHLTAELVGRFQEERRPFSAIALHADTSSLTAIGNDYGFDEVFARQVLAHGRAQDVLVLLSSSGRSRNLLRAAQAGVRAGVSVWALTGAGPNPLASLAESSVCVPGGTANVQEAHLAAVHIVCRAFDAALADMDQATAAS